MPGDSLKISSLYRRIHDVVRQIPHGKVATYAQIAKTVGNCTPRMAGYAMAAVPSDSNIPWHRVINSQGKISLRLYGDGHLRQRQLLEAEGVHFDPEGCVDLNEFRWKDQGKKTLKPDELSNNPPLNIEKPLSIHRNGRKL